MKKKEKYGKQGKNIIEEVRRGNVMNKATG